MDSGEYDSTDYASLVALYGGEVGKKGRQREQERGFTGTALHGLHAAGLEAEGGSSGQEGEQQPEGGGAKKEEEGGAEPMAQG